MQSVNIHVYALYTDNNFHSQGITSSVTSTKKSLYFASWVFDSSTFSVNLLAMKDNKHCVFYSVGLHKHKNVYIMFQVSTSFLLLHLAALHKNTTLQLRSF